MDRSTMNLRELFSDKYSKSAFTYIDGELRLVGKWGQVSKVGNLWDVWFICTERRLSDISDKIVLKYGDNSEFNRLTGEAFIQTKDAEKVLFLTDLCGIRKKRQISDKERMRLSKIRQNIVTQT